MKSRTFAKRRRDGLCPHCGGAPTPGKATCLACLERQRAVYADRRARGICYCGRPRTEGRTRCDPCLARNQAAAAKRRVARVASGLCECGKAPRPGKQTCLDCGKRSHRVASLRRSIGLCPCGKQSPANGRVTCQQCIDYRASVVRSRREEVVRGYGGKCATCDETDPHVMELDHVDGPGEELRGKIRGRGNALYQWAIRNGFPARFRILCANCQLAKARLGDCGYREMKSERP